jgi:alkylation response protein AidB-like acyl-CoA dehydrogenase
MPAFAFPPGGVTPAERALRSRVREFLDENLPSGRARPRDTGGNGWGGYDPAFSRALAGRGWVGMALPTAYGGHGASAVARLIVTEELLAAGAPVSAHWVADRQSGPSIAAYGTEAQKRRLLPEIARAEKFWAIGMSEPEAGSDLAAVRTRAEQVDGGWLVSGRKVWTSWAHRADYFAVLCRTDPPSGVDGREDRHAGLSQLIVDLHSDGLTISPIATMSGAADFCEVALDDVFVPADLLLGRRGDGWRQVTGELGYERAGAERWMSVWALFTAAVDAAAKSGHAGAPAVAGRMLARFRVLHELSLSVARSIDGGAKPAVEAAMVKDLGTVFEQDVVEWVRDLLDLEPDPGGGPLEELLSRALLISPVFTIRGGTTEVLRSILAARMRT